MTQFATREQNRFWIAINYTSLIAALIVFYTGKHLQWPVSLMILVLGAVAAFGYSFIRAFMRTGFWKMVHTAGRDLDEREMHVVLTALRYSYSAFTVLCLILIYAFAIAESRPMDVILAGGLLYLAHTLPATIIGWTEQVIDSEAEE